MIEPGTSQTETPHQPRKFNYPTINLPNTVSHMLQYIILHSHRYSVTTQILDQYKIASYSPDYGVASAKGSATHLKSRIGCQKSCEIFESLLILKSEILHILYDIP